VIIVPSFAASDLPSPAIALDLLGEWAWFGFPRLNLLSDQRPGSPIDRRTLELICRETAVPVQVELEAPEINGIADLLDAGASSVIVGSRALDEPDWLLEAVEAFPQHLGVTVPARERRSRSRGAVRVTSVDMGEEIASLSGMALSTIVVAFGGEAIGHRELAELEDDVSECPVPIAIWTSVPTIELFRDLEFRGVAAAIAPRASLSAVFDEHTLARGFAD
jgi:phosphoribosylformimino-5-aminoimidazole carboxamide ribotide isomerase